MTREEKTWAIWTLSYADIEMVGEMEGIDISTFSDDEVDAVAHTFKKGFEGANGHHWACDLHDAIREVLSERDDDDE